MSYYVSTAPATEPLSLTEAKSHLRVTATDEDTLITSLIVAARTYCEQYLWRSLITQSLTLELDCLPSGTKPIVLPGGPVQSLTSLHYTNTSGVSTEITDAQENLKAEPAELTPAYETSWPASRKKPQSVTIVYVAGFGDAGSDVPEPIRHAMRLLIGDYYTNRENAPIVPIGSVAQRTAVENLMTPYRMRDQRLLEHV